MSDKIPWPAKTRHTEESLTQHFYRALKSCGLSDDEVETLMQMHRDDPDAYDLKTPDDDPPHPLYLLREAEQSNQAGTFWSNYKAKDKHHQ